MNQLANRTDKIVVVDDDARIRDLLRRYLAQEGFEVIVAEDAKALSRIMLRDAVDLIVLDLMMPGEDGLSVCRRLRAAGDKTPIIMLTAKDQNRDIVNGLDSGADDYLAKPFSFEVLGARIRALLRRPQEVIDNVLTAKDVELDTVNRTVKRAGKEVSLSNKEFAILEYLMRNKNQIMSKQNIMTHVWDFDADILPNNVEVFINYLRGKIDKPFKQSEPLIQTVRGFGYVIKDDA